MHMSAYKVPVLSALSEKVICERDKPFACYDSRIDAVTIALQVAALLQEISAATRPYPRAECLDQEYADGYPVSGCALSFPSSFHLSHLCQQKGSWHKYTDTVYTHL